MKKITAIAIACLAACASPASAQTVSDDVHCFLLSNVFAKQGKEPKGQQLAEASVAFYLGRLDGRADAATIARAMRKADAEITPQAAGTQMNACATRMMRAQQTIQTAVKSLAPTK